MRKTLRALACVAVLACASCSPHANANANANPNATTYRIGTLAKPDAIAPLDIDVAPNGTNLPNGRATAQDGFALYRSSCAACHGARIALARWPSATSLFDYIRRAMPPRAPRSLSPADLYAVTAYLLFADGRAGEHDIIDRNVLIHYTFSQTLIPH